MEYELTRCDEH